ncbi:MAG: Gfo/Idh/MocA family oxidoreductase [Acidobacteria bacterium]|nr:Gfo/Idh/MocA family oxidoreductase [Acidobacteriota bacterium]
MSARIALIGCGAAARRIHLPAYRETSGAEVVAFASATRASAEAAAAEWGSGIALGSWREALETAGVDAVDICAPNSLHAEIAVAAAAAGKHVLVEKPVARTLAEADRMIEAARASDVVLAVAHNSRFAPPFVAAREAIAAGRIGSVVAFRAAFGHAGPEAWAPGASWFFDPERSGGGALIDLGIHLADLVRAVLADEVAEVAAMLGPRRGGVEESAQVILRLAGGATGSLHVSWRAVPGPDHQLTVFGTGGTIHVDSSAPLTLQPATGGPTEQLPIPQATPGPCGEFVRAVETGAPPSVSGEDGRAALAIVEAAYRAAATGRATSVER